MSFDEICETWRPHISCTLEWWMCKRGNEKRWYRPLTDSGSDGVESLEAIASENSQFFVDVDLANDKGVSEDGGEPRGRSGYEIRRFKADDVMDDTNVAHLLSMKSIDHRPMRQVLFGYIRGVNYAHSPVPVYFTKDAKSLRSIDSWTVRTVREAGFLCFRIEGYFRLKPPKTVGDRGVHVTAVFSPKSNPSSACILKSKTAKEEDVLATSPALAREYNQYTKTCYNYSDLVYKFLNDIWENSATFFSGSAAPGNFVANVIVISKGPL